MKYQHDWLADVRQALAARPLVDPPTWVRDRAHRLYFTRSIKPQTLLARVKAALVFDSRQTGFAAAGVRSIAVLEGPWQLLYRGGDVDVDLLVRPNQDGHTLTVRGQALSLVGDVVGAGFVEAQPIDEPRRLHAVPSAPVRTEVEPSGEFALANLERGRYDVFLRLGAREIELNGVEL
jgi:hypothetical protein